MAYQLPNILVFSGSTRTGSFNEQLAGAATKALSGLDCDVARISLSDYPLPLYNGDLEAKDGIPENAVKLARLFHQADGVFIASPEYNSSVTPLLKNTLDWVSRVSAADDKPLVPYRQGVFALGAASNGALGGNRGLVHLRAILVSVGGLVISEQATVSGAANGFTETEELANERSAQFLLNTCKSLVEKATMLKSR